MQLGSRDLVHLATYRLDRGERSTDTIQVVTATTTRSTGSPTINNLVTTVAVVSTASTSALPQRPFAGPPKSARPRDGDEFVVVEWGDHPRGLARAQCTPGLPATLGLDATTPPVAIT